MRVSIPYRNLAITRTTAKLYEPARRCIYCPDGKPPFTKEHIIPGGLGGGLVFPESSCSSCQAIINAIETYCMRHPFLSYRLARGLVRNLKDLPDEIPMKMKIGAYTATIRFPRENFPRHLCLPQLVIPPGMLCGRPPGPFPQFPFWIGGDEERLRTLNSIGNLILVDEFKVMRFFRMVAKIAHGFATAELGFDSFDPMLPEFILGKDDNAGSFLIGGWPEDGMHQPVATCQIGHAFCEWGSQTLVNVRLRFFPEHPMIPIYHVIVGAITKPLTEILEPLGLKVADPNDGQ